MQRISSRMTFFTKRVFPMAWFGFLVVWVVAVVMSRGGSRPIPVEILLIPAVMVVFGYFLMKKLVFDLVDEVWDAGSELIVRNKTVELHVPLAEIMNVSYTMFTNPQRVTLLLRENTPLGNEITFVPPARLFPLSRSPIVDDLIRRVDAARRR
jgi:hypothetical protein